ncbi:MAG TPA: hypothetical protein PLV68_18335, partial [Ilumatobacteraceae bacterium]|nr:hypothetical protein [Ilumatobacteraceae bacterium]
SEKMARNVLVIAEAIAAEWNAQGSDIDRILGGYQDTVVQRLTSSPETPSAPGKAGIGCGFGVLVLTLGIAALIVGIVGLVRANNSLRADAVAVGYAAPRGTQPDTHRFTADSDRSYSIYIDLDTSNENRRDSIVASVECQAAFQNGTTAHIRGSRQGTSTTIGDVSSIGKFDAPAGAVAVACYQVSNSGGGNSLLYFVTPGKSRFLVWILVTVGGGLLIALGIVLGIMRLVRKPLAAARQMQASISAG